MLSLVILSFGCKRSQETTEVSTTGLNSIKSSTLEVRSPQTFQNLTIFMISGESEIQGKQYITLSEGMKTKEVVVRETGTVRELRIDKNSDQYVFIHSGDIVKGGKQDRTIAHDIIIPPMSKNNVLESFCVEQGRWQQREDEEVSEFSENTRMLSSRDLKLASRYDKSQGKVWQKVDEITSKLSRNISEKNGYVVEVADSTSATSLQLALENKELEKEKGVIYGAFKDLVNTPNAIGFAYAINCEIYAVELYNSPHLFKAVWEKVLESVVVEAIGEEVKDDMVSITAKDVLDFIKTTKEVDKQIVKKLNKATRLRIEENKNGNVVFETEDLTKKQWVHLSYMKIDSTLGKRELGFSERQ